MTLPAPALSAAQLRQVALELQRWAARNVDRDLAVSKFLDRIDDPREKARRQAARKRRKGKCA